MPRIYGDRRRLGNNLNRIMKTLTVVTILLMIPTVVAGYYGMNVP
ncbi:MAG: hypothetical protein II150_00510, partial [Thermoguttaceae bacterium]|nr:hypothetical protein [Thermoguttaceae bacterium]